MHTTNNTDLLRSQENMPVLEDGDGFCEVHVNTMQGF